MKNKSASQTPRTLTRKAILLAITALALSASPGSRADQLCNCLRSWDNLGAGDWFDPSNWGPNHNDVPNCAGVLCPPLSGASEVDINNGGTAQITGLAQTARACETFLGKDSGQSGKLSVDHGTLDMCNEMHIGYEGKGTLSITNGGLVNTLIGGFIAAHAGSNGAATVDGTNPDGRKSTWTVIGGGMYVGGDNTSVGGTGLLTVTNEGRVSATNVHVWKSGTLTGNGTLTTTDDTTIDGTLSPSNTLTIGGNLSFGPLGTVRCNVTPSSWDRAEVSGAATLDGRLSVTMTGAFTPPAQFPLLHASTLVGTFSSVSITYSSDCLSPSVVYDYVNGYVYLHVESTCQ
jgi:T5SS/PEP-CTERM-associated repeat protein